MKLRVPFRRRLGEQPPDVPPEEGMGTDVVQEFYCASSGGGCGGYVMLTLHMALTGRVKVICPKCQHEHHRYLNNGVLQEAGRDDRSKLDLGEEIMPTIADWSAEPRTQRMLKIHMSRGKSHGIEERDAAVVSSREDVKPTSVFLADSWLNRKDS